LDPFFVVVVFRCAVVLLEEETAGFLGAAEIDFFAGAVLLDAVLLDTVEVFAAGFLAALEVVFFCAAGAFVTVFLAGAVASAASESSGPPIRKMDATATNNGIIR
jgi:hypothetical protein